MGNRGKKTIRYLAYSASGSSFFLLLLHAKLQLLLRWRSTQAFVAYQSRFDAKGTTNKRIGTLGPFERLFDNS
jgi:hypothetical protein